MKESLIYAHDDGETYLLQPPGFGTEAGLCALYNASLPQSNNILAIIDPTLYPDEPTLLEAIRALLTSPDGRL